MCCLTGCWDSVEINKRSMILELALDKNEDYVYDPNQLLDGQGLYSIFYSIPDFGKVSGTQSLAKDMETTIDVDAPTLTASISDLQVLSKNTVTFSHVKSILLGESLMQSPDLFKQVVEGMARNRLVARNTPILGVNGKAELTRKVENNEQPILGLYIMDYFNNKERATNFFNKQLLGNFIKDMEETGISTLPVFHVESLQEEDAKGTQGTEGGTTGQDDAQGGSATGESSASSQESGESGGSGTASQEGAESGGATSDEGSGNPMAQGGVLGSGKSAQDKASKGAPPKVDKGKVDISGGVVIKDYEMVDYLTREEVRSQLFVQGKIKNAPVVVIFNEAPLTYTIHNQNAKIKFEEVNNQLQCLVEIDVKGNVTEYLAEAQTGIMDEKGTEEMKALIAGEIISEVMLGVEKARAINIDFMGLGLSCYRKENDLWDKYEGEWETNVFKNMPVAVGVNVDIESTGIQE